MVALVGFWCAYLATPVALWWVARRGGRWLRGGQGVDPDATRCGACGYDVRGLPTDVCPECGGDLAVVGRTTGGRLARRRWGRRAAKPAWVAVTLSAGYSFTMTALHDYVPRHQFGRRIVLQTCCDPTYKPNGWPFLIVFEQAWDVDLSATASGHGETIRQWVLRFSSVAYTGPYGTMMIAPSPNYGLTRDVVADRWTLVAADRSTTNGQGFPPPAVLRRWAADIVAVYPGATSPLSPADLAGLAIAGGDEMACMNNGHPPARWIADQAALGAGGATPITWGNFTDKVLEEHLRPLWPPVAVAVAGWLVALVLGWRHLRRGPVPARISQATVARP